MIGEVDLAESLVDLIHRWRAKTRRREREAEWIDVVAERHAPQQCGFDGRGAAPHEGIIDDIAGLGEAFDEEARELRLEARAIGDFVERTSLALFRSPEFVDVSGSFAARKLSGDESRGRAELRERQQLIRERVLSL